MKLSLLYDTFTPETKNYVDNFAIPSSTDFKSLLQGTLASIPKSRQSAPKIADGIDASWLGTRLEVELPVDQQAASAIRKSIVPEMINQRFMWVDDYFHYDDWKAKQQ